MGGWSGVFCPCSRADKTSGSNSANEVMRGIGAPRCVPMYGPHTHAEKKCSLRYILAMPEPIYLDHAATTPVRPEVREAMEPFFGPRFGNPSSIHRWGREARVALDEARERMAACLGARTDEICFTSGGTESDNLAVLGAWRARRTDGRNAVVSTPIEHKAVLAAVHQSAREGAEERLCATTIECVVETR